jgi:hypothetical protein
MRRSVLVLSAAVLVALVLSIPASAFARVVRVNGTASAGTSSLAHPANHMNDGKAATYWAASGVALPQKARIDLGKSRSLKACDISWRGTPGFVLSGSKDGTNWTRLSNQRANTRRTTHTVVRGSYRYLRVRVERLPDRRTAGIAEWKVYAASTTPTVAPSPATGRVFNAKDYGAKGNGSTNDQPAIQTTINAASSAGGGTVYLPAGTYKLSGTANINGLPGVPALPEGSFNLALRNGVHVEGAGRSSTVVVGALANAHPFGGDHNNNIGVAHLTIKSTASGVDGTKFLQCSNVTIDDVLATDLYIGVALYSCRDSVIKDSTAKDCYGFGFCSGEADVLGYSGTSNNVRITNCTATGNQVNFRVRGTMLSVASPYSLRRDGPVRNAYTTISNCTSSNWTNAGYYCTYSRNLIVQDCRDSKGTWSAFQMVGVVNSVFRSNSGPITQINQGGPPSGYGACSGNTVN